MGYSTETSQLTLTVFKLPWTPSLNICCVFSMPKICQLFQSLFCCKLQFYNFMLVIYFDKALLTLSIGLQRQNSWYSMSHQRTLNLLWDGLLLCHPQSAWRKIKHSICYLIGHKVHHLPYKWKTLLSFLNLLAWVFYYL